MAISKISANMIDGSLTSSLVTGTLPAVSGVALLNAGGGIDTETTSDPLITSNPSGGVGTLWLNTTSGELFNCQLATTDNNVWINIGSGLGDIAKPFGGLGGGTTSGYSAGGGAPVQDTIEKYSFASSIVVSDHGNLAMGRDGCGSCSSATDGYAIGGFVNGPPVSPSGSAWRENIDRFSFASNTTATDHGDMTAGRVRPSGCSSSTKGYCVGGALVSNAQTNIIDTFTFGSNSNATDHGDMSMAGRADGTGQSSNTHGYHSGGVGTGSSDRLNIIDKFAFASNVTGTDHGDLTVSRSYCGGHSSITHGYTVGGQSASANLDIIDRFTFSSATNANDVGNLTRTTVAIATSSSTTQGFTAGGGSDVIDKYNFASFVTTTDHGDLAASEAGGTGFQV
jgi:hypothetical protein